MSKLTDPIVTRKWEASIDYAGSQDLVSILRQTADTIEGMSKEALALTYDHPEHIRQRLNCCGNSGP